MRRARAAQPRLARRVRDAGHWADGRIERLRHTRVKRPSGKAMTWIGGVMVVLVLGVAVFLAWFDWNKMRGPIGRFASARIHRTVVIDGDLKVHLLTWTPTATVDRVRISQPAWAGPGQMATVERAKVSIRLLPLLKREVFIPLIQLDKPNVILIRDSGGRANWVFSDKPSKGGTRIPPIQQFVINDGQLKYSDLGKKLFVNGTVEASEQRGAAYDQGFRLDGSGSVNGNPFRLVATGGPLINIDKDRPYPFKADMRGGATHIVADGSITRPFDLGRFGAALKVSGGDMADLFYLTGLTFPNTPPYSLSAKLSRLDSTWRLDGIGGKVGDSDLSGEMKVETDGAKPDLYANLSSRLLDFDDLSTIFGGAPNPAETASPEQKAIAGKMAAQQRLLPDAKLDVARLRSMNAELHYRARSVRSPVLPVRQASVDLTLRDGVLNLNPFAFRLTAGEVKGTARIDARKSTPVTDLDARLRGVNVQQFVKVGGDPITGNIVARAKLRGAGASVHEAASRANGSVTVVMPRGEIRQAFAELLGINAGKGLSMLLSKDPRKTELRCAVADFKVTNGLATAQTLVIDTGVVISHGKGTVNLETERMDLVLDGDSKAPRLLKLWTPITLRGPLTAPKPGVQAGSVAAQGGLALGLGALLSPLAAILPFVDPGLAKDADCRGLVASARGKGVAVSPATAAR